MLSAPLQQQIAAASNPKEAATQARIHSTFRLNEGEYSSSLWLPGCKSFCTTLHAGTEPGTPPNSQERRSMTSVKTAAVTDQINLRANPETQPPVHTTAPPSDEAQANRSGSPPKVSRIRLNTMPYPV